MVLKSGENQTQLVTRLEELRAKVHELTPNQEPKKSLLARIVDAVSDDPVYEMGTRWLGKETSLTRELVLTPKASRFRGRLFVLGRTNKVSSFQLAQGANYVAQDRA